MGNEPKIPGSLSTTEKLWEGFKHVGKKALKWGAILGAAALFVGLVPIGGAIMSEISLAIVPGLKFITAKLGIESAALTVAAAGAVVGGLFGAAVGTTRVVDAVEEANDTSIANMARAQTREMQMAALGQQYAEKQIALAQQAQQLGSQATPGMGSYTGVGRT